MLDSFSGLSGFLFIQCGIGAGKSTMESLNTIARNGQNTNTSEAILDHWHT